MRCGVEAGGAWQVGRRRVRSGSGEEPPVRVLAGRGWLWALPPEVTFLRGRTEGEEGGLVGHLRVGYCHLSKCLQGAGGPSRINVTIWSRTEPLGMWI